MPLVFSFHLPLRNTEIKKMWRIFYDNMDALKMVLIRHAYDPDADIDTEEDAEANKLDNDEHIYECVDKDEPLPRGAKVLTKSQIFSDDDGLQVSASHSP